MIGSQTIDDKVVLPTEGPLSNVTGSVIVLTSTEETVMKYVFEFPGGAVAEAVTYKYPDYNTRTVLCVSVQSGCHVGCTFCGSGNGFIRNLTPEEIAYQPQYILEDKRINPADVQKLQIMFMAMGEPFLNYNSVEKAIIGLHEQYPSAQLLVSTIAPRKMGLFDRFIDLSKGNDKIGLQFSIHRSSDDERDKLIPYRAKLTLQEIRELGARWNSETGRHPFCNYCIDGTNDTEEDYRRLTSLFAPEMFYFTFSVVCSPDETMRDAGFRNIDRIREFAGRFNAHGYSTRIFDPAGQDDIGGGCGQLWYVQNALKARNLGKQNS